MRSLDELADAIRIRRRRDIRGLPSSVAASREHRRAKTDRLDTELLKRGFSGWLPSTTPALAFDPGKS